MIRTLLLATLLISCVREQTPTHTEVVQPSAEPVPSPNDPPPPPKKHKWPSKGSPDRDGDGIVDNLDKCPDDPEDHDGFEDDDGCPDPDNDKDGVLDVDDKCPNNPGNVSNGGCP
jgi:hypothetical protein